MSNPVKAYFDKADKNLSMGIVGANRTGNSVRAWLSNEDLKEVQKLSERTGLKAVEIHDRILHAGIKAIVENGYHMTLPLEFDIVEPCKPESSRLELNESKTKRGK